ncbi:exportin-4-like [Ornithodoros turicata]|uniref:exportin-4-like n=1 Tax=Ornithodoros turicata TaxID=34597 RepID=UPI00313A0FEA
MASHVIHELETSAQILLAPPQLVTKEQRHDAERVFLSFQNTRSPFDLCKSILETSRAPYVQFQAAALLKQAVIREWNQLQDLSALRDYVLQYLTQRPDIESYVREELVLVVAIMVKRSSVDGDTQIIHTLLNNVSQLITSGATHLQTVGCSLLSALLTEFSSSTRATDVGLRWEVHLCAKKSFETTHLKKIFQFCLQGLSETQQLASGGALSSPPIRNLLRKLLLLAEQVLSWNFHFAMLLPRKLVGLFESQQCPTLRPGAEWKDIFIDQNVPQFFFKVYEAVWQEPELAHPTLQCLQQLATLNGAVTGGKEDRTTYLGRFLEGGLLDLMATVTTRTISAQLGVAQVLGRLSLFFPPPVLSRLPEPLVLTFLERLEGLSCHLVGLVGSAPEEEEMVQEALEHALDAWVPLLQDTQIFEGKLVQGSQIFPLFLRRHIAPPDGTRNVAEDNQEIAEEEEDDRVRFKDQLAVIGLLGRHRLEASLPLLTSIMEDRVGRLQCMLHQAQQQALSPNDGLTLNALNEDLHWALMITGHTLTTVSDGETTLIPSEVMQYSLKCAPQVDKEATLRLLSGQGVPGTEQATDPIVRLTVAAFRLCEVERGALEANLSHLLSPEVATSLVWFLRRWAATYLLPNESYYTELSPVLVAAFGRDTEAGTWVLNFLLGKLKSNLEHWAAEPDLVLSSSLTLVSLLNNVERGHQAASCPNLAELVRLQAEGRFAALAPAAKRALLKALVIAGTANRSEESSHYWDRLLGPLRDRFQALVGAPCFQTEYATPQVRERVLDLLESLTGLVEGITAQNLSTLQPFVLPLLRELVPLVGLYHNYTTVASACLQVLRAAVRRMLCFLSAADSNQVYECCLNMIKEYAKHNTGKVTVEASAEENQYQDVLDLMELLMELLSKDFCQFPPPTIMLGPGQLLVMSRPESGDEPQTCASDVALYGLNILMPIMSIELLKFPSLCLQYFKLVTLIGEIYPNKICQLPENLFQNLMSSIQIGLTQFTAEVSSICLDFLSVLGIHVYKAKLFGSQAHHALEPFLKMVLEMVLLQPLDAELTQTAGNALFTLICCFHEQFQELGRVLVASQADAATGERLARALQALGLNSGTPPAPDRAQRMRFRENFETFVADVRGFLCVK